MPESEKPPVQPGTVDLVDILDGLDGPACPRGTDVRGAGLQFYVVYGAAMFVRSKRPISSQYVLSTS